MRLQSSIVAAFAVVALLAGTTARAAIVQFDFPITVSQEVPVPTIPGLNPAGVGQVTLNTDTNLLSWSIIWAGLSGPVVAPGMHIHGPAPIGVTAGVLVDLAGNTPTGIDPIGGNVPLPLPASGSLSGSAITTPTIAGHILAGNTYVNIHTALNPAGEIRGQIIPEPAALGLAAVAAPLLLRRRRA